MENSKTLSRVLTVVTVSALFFALNVSGALAGFWRTLDGITATGVSYWESGNATPNTETLNKLSNYFGVTVNYLLGIKDKIEEEDNSRTAIIFRKAEQVDPKEKEKLLDILDSTIDIFLGNNKNG